MPATLILGGLAFISLLLLLWQWLVTRRFPLHQRQSGPSLCPPVTLLKPLKGCDDTTAACLRSWLAQEYAGPVQVLFGVASADDPVCELARALLKEFPAAAAQVVVCGPLRGANLKVAKLAQLAAVARHELVVVSDADVLAPPDLLANLVPALEPPAVGLVHCFYRLASRATLAMRWEAVVINADFWGQVLQARSLKPLDFALGAVMATRRRQLAEIGGFEALADCLADDYQLGHRIAARGYRIAICPVVVECWSAPLGWQAAWKHQLRWARTVRVCQPGAYFFSILGNTTLWPLVFLAACPGALSLGLALVAWTARVLAARAWQRRMVGGTTAGGGRVADGPWPRANGAAEREQKADAEGRSFPCSPPRCGGRGESQAVEGMVAAGPARVGLGDGLMALVKDLLQAPIWLLAFTGNRIEWRGERLRVRRDGTMVRG